MELAHGRRAQLGHHITAHDFKAPEFLFRAFTSLAGSRTGDQRVIALQGLEARELFHAGFEDGGQPVGSQRKPKCQLANTDSIRMA